MTAPRPPADEVLDLLLDALAERQARRLKLGRPAAPDATASLPTADQAGAASSAAPAPAPEGLSPVGPIPASRAAPSAPPLIPHVSDVAQPERPASHLQPPTPPLGRTLGRLWALLAALVIVVNVPLGAGGLNLAHLVPSTASLIIRDGLVLKGPGPEIYVIQNDKLRWITSLDAFDFFGYRWDQVHEVDQAFLSQFQPGAPLSVLLKCDASPHIYALELGHKRWIKDIATFTAQGYVWTDVKMVDCDYLRGLPAGTPIPADAGPPPEP